MAKSKKPPEPAKPSPPSGVLPVPNATDATVQLLYSAQIARAQAISGPLPPPELLRQYDSVCPGLAERIVKMAEEEVMHRRAIERESIAVQARDQISYRRSELFGQVFGLLIGIAAIGGAVYCATHGAQVAGSIIGTGGVTGLVTTFILGRNLLLKQRQQEFQHQLQLQERRLAEIKQL